MSKNFSYVSLFSNTSLGLVLEGAAWAGNQLALNDGQAVRLNPSQIRWVQADPASSHSLVNLPVYLNSDRADVLFTIDLAFNGSESALVAMRAVCLTAGG